MTLTSCLIDIVKTFKSLIQENVLWWNQTSDLRNTHASHHIITNRIFVCCCCFFCYIWSCIKYRYSVLKESKQNKENSSEKCPWPCLSFALPFFESHSIENPNIYFWTEATFDAYHKSQLKKNPLIFHSKIFL